MAKRGPRQDALRWHTTKGWYFVIDGKAKYFGGAGPRETSDARKKNAALLDAALKRWHSLSSVAIAPLIPETTRETAISEILSFVDDPDCITDLHVDRWIAAAAAFDKSKRAEILMELGLRRSWIAEHLDSWEGLTSGKRINPQFPDQDKATRLYWGESRFGKKMAEGAISDRSGPTCRDAFDVYSEYLRGNTKDWKDTISRLKKHWLPFIGEQTPIQSLRREQFKAFQEKYLALVEKRLKWETEYPARPIPQALKCKAPGMSPSSFNKLMVLVKGIFNVASNEIGGDYTLPEKDRCLSALCQTTGAKRECTLIAKADLKRMLSEFEIKWQCICLVALNMAGSNTDISELRWSHIRWDEKLIDFTRGKNNRIRRTPVFDLTMKKLAEWKKVCPSQSLVFTTRDGRSYVTRRETGTRRDSVGEQFKENLLLMLMTPAERKRYREIDHKDGRKKARSYRDEVTATKDTRVRAYTFATWRKSGATRAAEMGAVELGIKMLLGDAPNEVWRHYAQAVPRIVAKAVAGIEEFYGLGHSIQRRYRRLFENSE